MRIASSNVSSLYSSANEVQGLRATRMQEEQQAQQQMQQAQAGTFSPAAAQKAVQKVSITEKGAAMDANAQEQKVLAREQSLKASAAGGSVSTTYTYATGPDGKRYIAGAEVTITAPQDILDAIPGGKPASGQSAQDAEKTGANANTPTAGGKGETKNATGDDPAIRTEVAKLKQTERDVIAHEAAHKAVGGQYAGAASYFYTTGPDGKKYITGGEVSISTPATDSPEEALRMAEQIRKAALAPADPSGQDISVAAAATQKAASARAEIVRNNRESLAEESSSVETQAQFSGKKDIPAAISGIDISRSQKAASAYESHAHIHKANESGKLHAVG